MNFKDLIEKSIKTGGNMAMRQFGYTIINSAVNAANDSNKQKKGETTLEYETVKKHPLTLEDELEKIHLGIIELKNYERKNNNNNNKNPDPDKVIKDLRKKLREDKPWKEEQFIAAYAEEQYEYQADREKLSSLAARLKYLVELKSDEDRIKFLEQDLRLFNKFNRFYLRFFLTEKFKKASMGLLNMIKEEKKKVNKEEIRKIAEGTDKNGKKPDQLLAGLVAFSDKLEEIDQKLKKRKKGDD